VPDPEDFYKYKLTRYGIVIMVYHDDDTIPRLWSRVWASETFQCCYTCRIYSANICTPFTVILTTVPVAHWANAYTMPHDQVQLLTL